MLFDLLAIREDDRVGGLPWHYRICSGFSAMAVHRTAKALGVSAEALGELVGVPPQQLAWVRRGQAISPEASDTLFRVARAFSQVFVVLKDEEACAQWLRNPQKDLGHRAPIVLLLSATGTEEVNAAIDKLRARQRAKVEVVVEEREAPQDEGSAEELDKDAAQDEEALQD